jgi:hypothetical protein
MRLVGHCLYCSTAYRLIARNYYDSTIFDDVSPAINPFVFRTDQRPQKEETMKDKTGLGRHLGVRNHPRIMAQDDLSLWNCVGELTLIAMRALVHLLPPHLTDSDTSHAPAP